ncbi:MAG: hypothetical protein JF588_06335 [Caulobacterales bacterium]|nr:hypothetical protein [Caulobacterales bacterium]
MMITLARTLLPLTAISALAMAGCDSHPIGTAPQGSKVAAAMPDTNQPRDPNREMTAPDAGQTGEVPASGAAPAVKPTPETGAAPAAADPRPKPQ